MRTLTAYMSDAGKICPMVLLIDGELKRNADEAAVSPDLTEGEKDRLREWIENARALCAEYQEDQMIVLRIRRSSMRSSHILMGRSLKRNISSLRLRSSSTSWNVR